VYNWYTFTVYAFELPADDILLHTDYFSILDKQTEIEIFLNCLKSLTEYRLKIFIADNNQLTLESTFYQNNWQKYHRDEKQNCQFIEQLLCFPNQ